MGTCGTFGATAGLLYGNVSLKEFQLSTVHSRPVRGMMKKVGSTALAWCAGWKNWSGSD